MSGNNIFEFPIDALQAIVGRIWNVIVGRICAGIVHFLLEARNLVEDSF